MGEKELRDRPRRLSRLTLAGLALLTSTAALSVPAHAVKKTVPPTTTEPPAATFCDGWAQVRSVRTSGRTGVAALRLQAERYRALIGVSPKDIRPQVTVMADYFTTTLAIADKPLNNDKLTAALEALIPKIGDALTAVTRHAVRTCPRSLLQPTTTAGPTSTSSAPPTTAKKR